MKRRTACELTENSPFWREERRNPADFPFTPLLPAKLSSVASQPAPFATGCYDKSMVNGPRSITRCTPIAFTWRKILIRCR
jgi:hypothetical protein